MSFFEIITSLLSLLAIIVSFVSIYRARETQAAFLELEKIHAEVSKNKLEEIKEKERNKIKANIVVSLKDNKFIIYNESNSPAYNIDFEIAEESGHDPLVKGDYDHKLRYPKLEPDSYFTLMAIFDISITQQIYPVILSWDNSDGTTEERKYHVSIT